jgi:uncharacterized protein (UPF0332 family)
MTDPNRRAHVAHEDARAAEALRAARALVDLGLDNDAVSRAYYSVYHMVRAALFSRGAEPKTHAGMIHLFNVELVRTGAFPGTFNRVIAGLQRSRELADYDAAVKFSHADAVAELSNAEGCVAALRELLVREGWLA